MTTIMCQGLHEPLQVKETTDTLLLTLTAPKSTGQESIFIDNSTTNHTIPSSLDLSGWSWSNLSQPIDVVSKSFPSSRLTEKSLELCTENLGNETGSDTSESSILEYIKNEKSSSEKYMRRISSAEKKADSHSFPPPLTTIRSLNSFQVRPHRKDGRLIIKVVETPSIGNCFEAHRAHGRLQLRFAKQKVSSENQEDATEKLEQGHACSAWK